MPVIWHTEKATTDIAMATNWISAGFAASCKEKSARFLERNAHKPPRFIALDSLELCFQSNERINRYQLVAQFISASASIFFFFFFKIVKRKLHAILQKEDNYILPLGETTKMASADTPSASGSQQPGPAACGSAQPAQCCKAFSFTLCPVVFLNRST